MCDRGDSPEPLGWVRYNRILLWCADIVRVAVDGQRVRYSTEHEGDPNGRIIADHEEEARAIADRIAAARVAYELEKERLAGAHAQPEVDSDTMVDLVTLRVRRRAVIAAQESREPGITALMYGSLKAHSVIASHVPLPYAEVLRRLGLPARSETQEPA